MTSQDAPSSESPPTSALSEAVEQAVDVVTNWSADVTKLVKDEVDKLSAGNYRLSDVVAAPMRLTKIWVTHALKAAFTISDNITLISSARSGAPAPPRMVRVPVHIPANVAVQFSPVELTGQYSYHRIPPIDVDPIDKSSEARNVDVVVTVSSPHAPNDVYTGVLCSTDSAIKVPFAVAIHELGVPMS